jgi:hypothetical protein
VYSLSITERSLETCRESHTTITKSAVQSAYRKHQIKKLLEVLRLEDLPDPGTSSKQQNSREIFSWSHLFYIEAITQDLAELHPVSFSQAAKKA